MPSFAGSKRARLWTRCIGYANWLSGVSDWRGPFSTPKSQRGLTNLRPRLKPARRSGRRHYAAAEFARDGASPNGPRLLPLRACPEQSNRAAASELARFSADLVGDIVSG
jgi:hypothetical protein